MAMATAAATAAALPWLRQPSLPRRLRNSTPSVVAVEAEVKI